MPNDLESMAGMSIVVPCDDEKEPEPSNDLKEASPYYYVSTYEWENKKTSSYQIDVWQKWMIFFPPLKRKAAKIAKSIVNRTRYGYMGEMYRTKGANRKNDHQPFFVESNCRLFSIVENRVSF